MSPCVISTAFAKHDAVVVEALLNLRQHVVEAGNVGQLGSGELRRRKQQSDGDQGTPEQIDHADGTEKAGSRRIPSAYARTRQSRDGFGGQVVTDRARPRRCGEEIADEKDRSGCADDRAVRPRALERARGIGLDVDLRCRGELARDRRQFLGTVRARCRQVRVMTIVEAAGRSAFSMSDTSLSRSAPNTIGSGSGNSRFR